MAYRIEFRSLATIEILEAYDWYEGERAGLGLEFLDELETFYDSLLRNPNAFSYYEKPVRQGKMNRFPYVVVFEVFGDVIVVFSVFMTSQDPQKKRSG
jgi:toxin ParE1/3/4